MKINVSSMSDIITNSSTTTFIVPTNKCIENIKLVIKNIMKILNINGEIEDYFDIELAIDKEKVREDLLDRHEDHDRFGDKSLEELIEIYSEGDTRKIISLRNEELLKFLEDSYCVFEFNWINIYINPKDNVNGKFLIEFNKMFEMKEVYC